MKNITLEYRSLKSLKEKVTKITKHLRGPKTSTSNKKCFYFQTIK